MATFPSLRDGSVMRLTSSREPVYGTGILVFEDDSEQRFRSAVPLMHRTLVLSSIGGYDLANVREFWRSMKGRFDSTWDIYIDGAWEYHLAFDDDEFSVSEPRPGSFTVSLKCLQTRPN
jgi:hypothetical protein